MTGSRNASHPSVDTARVLPLRRRAAEAALAAELAAEAYHEAALRDMKERRERRLEELLRAIIGEPGEAFTAENVLCPLRRIDGVIIGLAANDEHLLIHDYGCGTPALERLNDLAHLGRLLASHAARCGVCGALA